MTTARRTVLIVADSSDTCAELQSYLASAYTCVAAATIATARALCHARVPDALLLSEHLPDGDGLEGLAVLLNEHGKLAFAIIMLLDADNPAIAAQALALGAHDYLTRGYDLGHSLGRTIAAAIAQVDLRRENAALQDKLAAAQQQLERAVSEARTDTLFNQAVLDSMNATVAVLDRAGTILAVNTAWDRFGRANGRAPDPTPRCADVGVNYLAVCQASAAAGEPEAQIAYDGIRSVLSGQQSSFVLEYPCHGPEEQRWFLMNVAPLAASEGGAVVTHTGITERKRAEQTLAQSEAQLAGIIESAMDAIITLDDDQRIVHWNAAAVRMFGCDAASAIGQPLNRFIPEHYHLTHGAAIRAFGATGETPRAMGDQRPLAARRADGSEFPIEASISHITVGGQQLFIAILRDITRRVIAAERLSAHAERLERLKEVAVALAGPLDSRHMSATILQHAAAAVGAPYGAILHYRPGEPYLHLLAVLGFSPGDTALLAELPLGSDTIFGDTIRTQTPIIVESPAERDARYPQLRRRQSSFGSAAVAFPLIVDKRIIGCFGLVFDEPRRLAPEEHMFLETLAQQCAQALDRALLYDTIQATMRVKEEALALLDTLFTNAPVGLAYLDRDLRFVRVNAALAAINDLPAGDLLGRQLADVRPELAPVIEPLHRTVLETGRPIVNYEIREPAGAPIGKLRYRVENYYPVQAPGAPPIGVGIVVVDLTDLKRADEARRESERKLAALVDILPIGVAILDRQSQIVYANPALEHIVGLSHAQLLAGDHHSLRSFRPDGTPVLESAFSGTDAHAEQQLVQNIELGIIKDNGSVTWMNINRVSIALADWSVVLTVADITERKHAEAVLRASEERFAKAFYANPAAMIITRLSDGLIIDANPNYQRILGYTPDELIGSSGPALHIHGDPDERQWVVDRLRQDGFVRNYETTLRAKSGELRSGLFSLELIEVQGEQCILSIFYDITERKHAEQALQTSRQQLLELSTRLVHAQEDERRALAYDLHDEIGQQLTALNVALEIGDGVPADQLRARLREAQQLLVSLTSQARKLSLNLRPPMIDDLGLLPTLLWHIERYGQQTNVRVDFKHSGLDTPLPPHIAIAAYRIVQEGLTNIARHAQTAAAVVRVWTSAGQLKIAIEDQGCGFDIAARPSGGRAVGLATMRERAQLIGGEFDLDSTPGEGTRIRVTLPLDAARVVEPGSSSGSVGVTR